MTGTGAFSISSRHRSLPPWPMPRPTRKSGSNQRARRDRSRQDGLLFQRESRISDTAHAVTGTHRGCAPFGDDFPEQIDLLYRNELRLLKLVNTLLDFARIEASRGEAAYQPIDLSATTADLASNFRSAAERAGLRFVVDCPPLPGPVFVDLDMWEKIVLNLLSNAFKFTFEGTIVVSLRSAGEQVELSVHDTGVGIPSEEQPAIFDRFHRVRSSRSRSIEGSGIGLALVKELVQLHGGTIGVTSVPGRGSTFTVRLPFGSDHLPLRERPAAFCGPQA